MRTTKPDVQIFLSNGKHLHAKLGSNILNPHKKNKVCPAAVDKKLSGRAARLASS